MMKQNTTRRVLHFLPLLLFIVLASCVLSVLLSGTKIYSSITKENQQSYTDRTIRQYIYTKIQQAEKVSDVSLGNLGDENALIIKQNLNNHDLIEYIYCYDGYLRELLTYADSEMHPEDGEKLLALNIFSPLLAEDLLAISIGNTDEKVRTIYFDLNGETFYEK